MFSFPPEFPFVRERKPTAPAAEPAPAPEPTPVPQPAFASASAEPEPPAAIEIEPEPDPQPVIPVREVESRAPAIATAPVVAPKPLAIPQPAAAITPRCERRKTKRDALCATALLRTDGYHGPPTKIELTDISIAGARFRCDRPLDIGEKAQVRLEVGPLRWTTRLRVVHCTRIDETHLSIGCAFLRTELLRPWPAAA